MKLFLSSTSVPGLLKEAFCNLIGKQPDSIRIALFENAADPYPEDRRGFVEKNYEDLLAAGFSIDRFDLRAFMGKQKLSSLSFHLTTPSGLAVAIRFTCAG